MDDQFMKMIAAKRNGNTITGMSVGDSFYGKFKRGNSKKEPVLADVINE